MCSRYTLASPDDVLEELGVRSPSFASKPRYNIAPTQEAPVILIRDGETSAELHRFGLIPSWADDPRIGVRLLNARSETARTKPAFRDALAKRRCLVATDGFIEWKKDGKKRLPHWFQASQGKALSLAGLWERWKGPDGWVLSFSILTAPANDQVASLHDRMPVIIDPDDRPRWLEPELGAEAISDLLVSYAGPLACTQLDGRINSVANDDPACLEPAPVQRELF